MSSCKPQQVFFSLATTKCQATFGINYYSSCQFYWQSREAAPPSLLWDQFVGSDWRRMAAAAVDAHFNFKQFTFRKKSRMEVPDLGDYWTDESDWLFWFSNLLWLPLERTNNSIWNGKELELETDKAFKIRLLSLKIGNWLNKFKIYYLKSICSLIDPHFFVANFEKLHLFSAKCLSS